MIRKILCATDLSPASEPALRTAFEFARKLDAMVYVLHVVEPPYQAVPWFVPAPLDQSFLKTLAERQEEAAIAELKKAIAGVDEPATAEPVVRTGGAVDSILSAAKDVGADLIVVGTHGRTGIRHLALGSVAERVVRASTLPVLSVRRKP
jgi:universal stress protein A